MRVAQISTVGTAVTRDGSGSIEGLVWSLAEELLELGHEVTVFATADSETRAELIGTLPGPYGIGGSPDDWVIAEWANLTRAIEESHRFDVMHSHVYLWSVLLERSTHAPLVHTTHISPAADEVFLWSRAPDACVTALSAHQWSGYPELRPAAVIHHGVDPDLFGYEPSPDDYVCYLGRFIPEKGPVSAIRAARSAGIRLVLAGPANEYYRGEVEPLVDGSSVEYVGALGAADREKLLASARALVYPVLSPEPFGLVLIEAMMCGTPVAARRLGAVPEIVDHDVTGYCVEGEDELAAALEACGRLERAGVRRRAELRFSSRRMAMDYASVYSRIASEPARRRP